VKVNGSYKAMNIGESKGLTFNRVLIYPTTTMMKWIKDHNYELAPTSRSRLYVAITRAKYSVGIVFDDGKDINIDGIEKFAE
jgi:DNA helicase-2/ATP-dependent DNA helicase PcrA